jgi:serine/threonine protein kinase
MNGVLQRVANCPDENMLAALVAGSAEKHSSLEAHLSSCRECRAVVSELAHELTPAATMHGAISFVRLPGYEPNEDRAAAFAPEERVADRYRILRFVASGGMGEVYEAEDLELHQRVALKAIRPHIAAERRVTERFKREILFARRVTHPNVCRIFDVGFHTRPSGERVTFLTMELLEGETLAARLHRAGRMKTEEALPLVQQMAAALSAAHAAGVVHRDFKSANVMLVSSEDGPRAVITDFGLARGIDQQNLGDERNSTEQRELVGTPAYMAPEQVALLDISSSVDVYALGVVMYEMLTGRLPFSGETPMLTAVKRLSEPPPSPRLHCADIPSQWERTILRCLERAPADRYARVGDVPVAIQSRATLPSPYVGKTISNHVLRRQIGVGRAPLFVAEHAQIDRRIVVQIFPAQLDAPAIARGLADAAAASAIHHPHLVEVFDFGPLGEGGSYLMSEWLDGRSLAALLRAEGRLPLRRALHVLSGVAAALSAAHARGLAHGEVDAEQVFLVTRSDDRDFVKLRGFGLARLGDFNADAATLAHADVQAMANLLADMLGVPGGALSELRLPPLLDAAFQRALEAAPAARLEAVAALMPVLRAPGRLESVRAKILTPRSRTAIFAALGVLAVAATFAISPHTTHVPPVAAPPVAAAVAAAPPAAGSEIELRLRALPGTAELRLDGALIANPYFATRPRDKDSHTLSARATGRGTTSQTLFFDRNQEVELALPLATAPTHAPSHRKKPTPDETPLLTDYPE